MLVAVAGLVVLAETLFIQEHQMQEQGVLGVRVHLLQSRALVLYMLLVVMVVGVLFQVAPQVLLGALIPEMAVLAVSLQPMAVLEVQA
jgi:hypothetical protein